MKNSIKIETSKESAEYILEVLEDHQKNYSYEFPSERIVKIREFIDNLRKNLYK